MSRSSLALIMLIVAALAACAPQPQDAAELPTLLVLPTLAPSSTMASSPTPTITPTATHTLTLTATVTPSITPTRTPAATHTASATTAPRNTPTNTITPTQTPVPVTETPTITPTSSLPQIITFTTSSTTAVVGGQVALTWEAVGDAVRIEQVNPQGVIVQTLGALAQSGSTTVIIPSGQGTQIIYRLVVTRGTTSETRTVTIAISGQTSNCPIPWFFANPPADAGCPTGPAVTADGAFQPFERGVMLYTNANTQNTVYGLANVGGMLAENSYNRAVSTWNGTDTYATFNCAGAPPQGFATPDRQFAWAYCNTNAPIGTWNYSIGWPTAPIDTSQRTIQFGQTGIIFIDSPSGIIYRLNPFQPNAVFATWSRAN